jgi:hypothetical protein
LVRSLQESSYNYQMLEQLPEYEELEKSQGPY